MTYVHVPVERVRGFLKWNPHRFENLDDKSAVAPLDPWGWRRNDEWWIRPPIWREQVCGGDLDPQELARTLKAHDLLRVQDDRNFQCAVKVKGATPKAYVVYDAIFVWEPAAAARSSRGFGGAAPGQYGRDLEPKTALLSIDGGIAASGAGGPDSLAALLDQGARLALLRGVELLSQSPDPSDRNFSQHLRSMTSVINTLISTQTRVEVEKFRAAQSANKREKILAIVEEERAKIKIIEAQAGVRQPAAVATPGED